MAKFVFPAQKSQQSSRIEIRSTVAVTDSPIASELDVMERQWQLDTLRSQRVIVLGAFQDEQQGTVSPQQLKKHRRAVKRLDRAIAMLEAQLDVWKVHDQ